jgi:hypothetical protein
MKRTLFAAFLSLFVSTHSAMALAITHLEDSTTRTWFSVSWGVDPFDPLVFLENGPLSDAGAMDMTTSIQVDFIHPFDMNSFDIVFAVGSRLFSGATLVGFEGVQFFPLPGDDYGAQFVYGEALPSEPVPDTGATVGLLGLGLALLSCGSKFIERGRTALKSPDCY